MVWIAAVAGVMLLGLAGFIVYLAAPDLRFDAECDSGWGLLAVLATVAGILITAVGAARARGSRSWASAAVPFNGLCLIICGIALFYLHSKAWGEGCSD